MYLLILIQTSFYRQLHNTFEVGLFIGYSAGLISVKGLSAKVLYQQCHMRYEITLDLELALFNFLCYFIL